MPSHVSMELQEHYLELCEAAKEEPQPAMLDLIAAHGAKPETAKRLALLEHLGESVNQEREALTKMNCWIVLDALQEAGYEDIRILRPENRGS